MRNNKMQTDTHTMQINAAQATGLYSVHVCVRACARAYNQAMQKQLRVLVTPPTSDINKHAINNKFMDTER